MPEEIKDVNKKVDEMEAAVKKYASKDTVISIGGYEFTPAKLMVAFTLASSILGGLYGTFEVYKDYQSMKKKIADYVTPDLTEVHEKLAVIEKQTELTKASVQEATGYANEIKNDLKRDIRRVEGVAESVERSSKEVARETTKDIRDVRNELKQMNSEVDSKLRQLNKEVDVRIQKALDNPLAGK